MFSNVTEVVIEIMIIVCFLQGITLFSSYHFTHGMMTTMTNHAFDLLMTRKTERTCHLLSVIINLLSDKTLVSETILTQETNKMILTVTSISIHPTI